MSHATRNAPARLSRHTVDRLPGTVTRFGYDRDAQQVGIVHLGLGAFHRAHQAVYTDAAMDAGDRHWAIAGVSLRSPAVRDSLAPQDCLYTVSALDGVSDPVRLIGAIKRAYVAAEAAEQVIGVLASASTLLVTLTVTEKGYYQRPDGTLDAAAPEVASDLSGYGTPQTVFGYLRAALMRRRDSGLPGLTVVCCDNLAQNGERFASLLDDFLGHRDVGLARWVRTECACPSTMVDRIVPAATPESRARVASRLGLVDEASVMTEPFTQWLIQDRFAGPRPRWEAGGAQFVVDVAPYEAAKLRMLNGAHSALAYMGLEHGHNFVHEAIADPGIRSLVERLMREEAAPSLPRVPGQDLMAYADALLTRFANPALPHRLAQIAMDGSKKIPQRWLPTLRAQQHARRQCPAILTALAAWIVHVRGDRRGVDDPAARELMQLWVQVGRTGIVDALFSESGRFASEWIATPTDAATIQQAMDGLLA